MNDTIDLDMILSGTPSKKLKPKGVVESPKGVVESPKGVVESPEGVVERPKGVVERPKGVVERPNLEDPYLLLENPENPENLKKILFVMHVILPHFLILIEVLILENLQIMKKI